MNKPVRRTRVEDVLPLSPLQEGLLFHALYDGDAAGATDVYTVSYAFDLSGPLDVTALRASAERLLARHANLRAGFRQKKTGETVQVIAREAELPWTFRDLSGVSAQQREQQARLLVEADRAARFDLAAPPLLRFLLLRLAPDHHRLVFTNHHLLLDGWSLPVLVRELFTGYAGGELPRPTPYRDYLAWLSGRDSAAAEAAWREVLAGVTEPTLIAPADPARTAMAPDTVSEQLSPELTGRLRDTARANGLTLNTLVQGAWAVLLGRHTGRADVVFGATVSGRPPELPGVESMVGLFINTVPVRVRLDPATTLRELLTGLQAQQAGMLEHQYGKLSDIQQLAGVGELFDTLTVFENYPLDPAALTLPGTELRLTDIEGRDATHYPLTLVALPGETLRLRLDYRPDVVDAATAGALLTRLLRVLTAIVETPELPLGRLDLLAPAERERLLVHWNGPAARVWPATLPELFEYTVDCFPEAPALVHGETVLSYAELNERANRVARALVRRGVGPERLVALMLPRSMELVIAQLAVVKAGGAYLPIDPDYPADRIAFTLTDAAPVLVLTAPGGTVPVEGLPVASVAGLDDIDGGDLEDQDRIAPLRTDHPAYVIYTSGSTGVPKGVVVTHHGLAAFAESEVDRFDAGPYARVLQFASPSFDASVLELCLAIRAGAALVVPDAFPLAGEVLADVLIRHRITHALIPPAALASLPPVALPEFRSLIVGGDATSAELVARWSVGRRMVNAYGPTESTVVATTSGPLAPGGTPPIGSPLPGTRVYVLDANLAPVPIGVAGELYLAGDGLARGYLNRPGLTAQRFVPDPFGRPGERMYRTGDLVSWTQDGELAFHGRADDQVKVRGFRIELGEIESVLLKHRDVRQAAVIVREDRPGVRRLVGYVVPAGDTALDLAALRAHAAAALPEHMLPSALVELAALPVTANGSKLDRAALPAPEPASAGTASRPPRTPAESVLAELFAEVLGVDSVGVEDSFFDLGGDSIISIQLVSRARRAGLLISPKDVFTSRTVAALAAVARPAGGPETATEEPDGGLGEVPLTPVMHWLREQGGPVDSFHQSMLLTVPAGVGAHLPTMLAALLDTHDALRARLCRDVDHWSLVVPPRGAVSVTTVLSTVDASGVADLAPLIAEHAATAATRLDPAAGRMVVAVHFDTGAGTLGRLLLLVHHFVVDGVSWRILLPDLQLAWQACVAGRTPQLPPVPTSFRRWALGLTEQARTPGRQAGLALWSRMLERADPPLAARPLDPAVDTVASLRHLSRELPTGPTADLLTTVPAAFHGAVEDVLLTALTMAVGRWRDRDDVLLHLESHGRHDVVPGTDISRTVGWFTNTYPVRLDLAGLDAAEALAGGPAAGTAIKRVKEQLRAVPDHGIGHGLLRYLNPDTAGALSGRPHPQLGFNYLGRFTAAGSGDWTPAPEAAPLGGGMDPETPVPHAIEINAITKDTPDGPRLSVTWSWPGALFTEDDVAALAELWFAALTALGEHAAQPGSGGRTPSDVPLTTLSQSELDTVDAVVPAGSDLLPLSPLQRGLLFHALYDGTTADVYTVQLRVALSGPVDVAAFRAAARTVLRRHASLRTGFWHEGLSTPVSFVPPVVPLPWTDVDLSELPDPGPERDRVLAEDKARRFDVAAPPLLRFTLIRLPGDEHLLVLTNHHILLDGWSVPLLAGELFTLYGNGNDPSALPPVTPYRDYLAWLAGQDRTAAERAWQDLLTGVSEPTLLAGRATAGFPGAPKRHVLRLDAARTAELSWAARAHGVTLNTVVQGAWGVLLAALTGRSDVTFGATVSGRPAELPGVESIVGLFINTLPVRVRLDPAQTWAGLLVRLQEQQAGMLAHQYLGLTDVQGSLGLGELFDTLTVFENYPLDPAGLELPGTGLAVRQVEVDDATHYPLTLIALPGDNLELVFSYRPDVFDAETVRRLAQRLTGLLELTGTEPERPVGRIDVLLPEEAVQLAAWQGEVRGLPGRTVPRCFAEQAARTPEATALIDGDAELSYAELDRRANRLAHRLIELGVGPETCVALLQQRSVDLVVATLAVLKAGGAYVPLDARSPDARLATVLAMTGAVVLLTDPDLAARERTLDHAATVVLVDGDTGLAGYPDTNPDAAVRPDNLAYVMYTSGSTGTPKGVAVTHRDVCALAFDRAWDGTNQERVLLHSPHAFDASTYELWVPLLAGRQLVVAPSGELALAELARLITRHRITALWLTAGLFRLLAEESPECFSGVREVWSGGDVVPAPLVRRVLEHCPGLVIGDGYGPTETTTFATHHLMRSADEVGTTVPIGRPLDDMRVYVLDARLRPAPPGAAGELYIGGAGVARGYLGRPAATAERFVADPLVAGERMYRTGDLVRFRADGALEFVGRVDEQVKIRGFRIELGEIEAALVRPGVAQVAVIVREDRPGDKRLVAYLVPESGGGLDADALDTLRAHAVAVLPEYMVPTAFVTLDTLPLTANGKLDRRALPEPEHTVRGASRLPRNPNEEILCGLFAEVLGVPEIGIDDGFFALGGHSLLATRLVSRIRSALGVELAIRDLFEAPTVAALADVLDASAAARRALVRYERPELVPASYGQRRLWFLNQLEGAASPYKIPIGLRLTGQLDLAALQAALGDVLARHEVLRTVYPEVNGEPVQVVLPVADALPSVVREPIAESVLRQAMHAEVAAGFDLATDAPLRVRLFEVGECEYVLLIVLHHIAGDGWSMAPLARDFGQAYAARLAGTAPDWTPLPVQYADYSLWQRDIMGTEDDPDSAIAAQVAYWRDALAGLPEELELPTDRPRPPVSGEHGGMLAFELDAGLHAALTELARQNQTSLFMVLQAGLAALLTRLGTGTDIPIGSPIAGRTDEALDELVGFFVNTLVLRTDTAGDPTFRELLRRVRDTVLAAYANQDLPFERLVEVLKPVRAMNRNPLFQVLLVLQNNARTTVELPGLAVELEPAGVHAAQFDLSLDFTERTEDGRPAGMTGRLDYSADLFDAATIETLVARLVRLLTAVSADPDAAIGALPILEASERNRLLLEFNTTSAPEEATGVVEWVRHFAATTPDASALADDDCRLDYAALAGRAGALSAALLADGARPGEIAAILADRSVLVPTAVLGVLGAGAAYTPLDPKAPAARGAGLLVDSGARWLLAAPDREAQAHELAELAGTGLRVLVLDEDLLGTPALPPVAGRPDDLAYVIFTSGSTGRPKGAMVHRRGMVNHLRAKVDELAMSEKDSVVQNAPLSFDISVWQMLAALTVGGLTRIVAEGDALDPAALFGLAARERITVLEVVPSLLRTALDAWDSGADVPALPDLRWLMVTGEALPAPVCRRWFARFPSIALVNAYGPTECSDDVTHAVLTEATPLAGNRVPIGRPIRNTRLYVLDALLEPVPLGAVGELCVGGAGVGHGYLGDPVKTARAFVPDPFSSVQGDRLYRTGDRVRFRPDGQLEFLGRVDHQVKIRGQRIELGEVEAALRAVPGASDAVVAVHADPAGQNRLVGYLVGGADGGEVPDGRSVREQLATVLPEAMVPSVVLVLDSFPLTRNGKVDRKALPEPDFGGGSGGRAPRTPTEHVLCSIFAEVLGLSRVGIDDGFFDLGGHSLLATRLVNRVRVVFGADLGVRALFEAPTVAGLAAVLAELAGAPARVALTARPRPERVPLSFVQRRIWFLNRLAEGAGTYNIPLVLRLSGELDRAALRAALGDLVGRHETLRTLFAETDGEPHQQIIGAELARPWLPVVDTTPELVGGLVDAAVRAGFDLAVDLPVRATLFALAPEEHVLVLVLHHIASDGASAGPLATDLAAAYVARRAGTAPDWAPLPVQYADYGLWQREVLGDENDPDSLIAGQLAYWRTALAGLPEAIELPTDRPRPPHSDFAGDAVPFELDAGLHAALAELARQNQTSLFMVLQAGLAALLTRLGAGTDIPIGSPIAGRTDEALDELVGFFVNTLVLRTDTAGDPSFTELLARVRSADLSAYAHQDLPFERLVEELNPPRSLTRHPLFQVSLAFQNHSDIALELPGLRIAAETAKTGSAKFDLSLNVAEHRDPAGAPGGIAGQLGFRTDLFDAETVTTLGDRLIRLLTAVAADPDASIGSVDLLDGAERHRMLVTWNDTATTDPVWPVPALFAAQATATPDAIAVIDGARRLSYAELHGAANALARRLVAAGAGPERFVAVALPRSAELVITLLAVLKAGAAYVPVDPGYPADRIEFMLADTGPTLLVTNAEVLDLLPDVSGVDTLLTDDLAALTDGWDSAELTDADRLAPLRLSHPAYVIYTSGSTGRPKGVLIEHRCLADYLAFARADYQGVRGLALLHSPVSFDLTVTAMFVPLVAGGTVAVTSFETAEPATVALLRERPATFVKATPSHLPLLAALPSEFSPTQELLLGGELLLGELVDEWRREHPGVTVLNMYGPTETTVNCTEFRIEPGTRLTSGPLPIGRPLDNTRVYVLDERLMPVPPGVPGELYVAGNGVARGYLNRPATTATKFLPNPFGAPGERMYRTGDVVRWQRDGNLFFLRRADDQVKLRGFRIELGEIESVLAGHPDVRGASVIVREDRPGDQRLVGYVVPVRDGVEPAALRAHVAAALPEYMVPGAIVPIAAIPLTPNGKVDRRALPAPEVTGAAGGRGPRDSRERLLCELFATVLGVPQVGIDDGFFDLGGHSLLATRLISRVRDTFGVELSIRSLFEAPTVAELATRLDGPDVAGAAAGVFDVLLPLRLGGEETPLFCVHPASGFGWSYAGLLRHLPSDVPVYALQSVGLAEDRALPESVAEVAEEYLARIRQVQPAGPYRLLGWSFGGMVAHEMAARLELDGECVEVLALLDSFPKNDTERAEAAAAFIDERDLFEALLDLAGYDRATLAAEPLDTARIAALLREQGGVLGELTESQLTALHRVFVNNTRLAREHVPGTVSGSALLFVATRDATEPDIHLRWQGHVTGAVHRVDVDSRHNDLTQAPALAEIGPVLAATLRATTPSGKAARAPKSGKH